jgi:hypothetical protein
MENRDDFSRLDAVDELIVELQREMISGAHREALERAHQAREFEEVRRSVELAKMEAPKTTIETKAKFIASVVGGIIVFVIGAAIQNGWLTSPPKKVDPKNAPIPVSTYQLPPVST